MSIPKAKLRLLASAALMGGLMTGGAAVAQEAIGLEEVVVTAERRATDVQRTPLAITAVTGDQLAEQNVTSVNDLQKIVPALSVARGGGFANVWIRGVGGGVFNQYGTPTVAYNLDGVVMSQPYATASSFYDLQRVEVLKGPQGTLYGRNATGGAINIIPNAPVLGAFEGAVSLQAGNYDTLNTSGWVNLPLTDTVAGRLSFATNRHDGYLSNGFNDQNDRSVRAQLYWEPTDTFSARLYVDYYDSDRTGEGDVPLFPGVSFQGRTPIVPGFVGQWLNPDDPWTALPRSTTYPVCSSGVAPCFIAAGFGGVSAATPKIPIPINNSFGPTMPSAGQDAQEEHTQSLINAHFVWKTGFGDLTFIPGYLRTEVDDIVYTAERKGIIQLQADQYTTELQLASNHDGPLSYVAGLYWYKQEIASTQLFFQQNTGFSGYTIPDLSQESWAAFGQLTWALTDSFRLTGGLRYTTEDIHQDGYAVSPSVALQPPPIGNPQALIRSIGDATFDSTDYLARAEWDITPDSLLFASYTTGFKAGGFNAGLAPNTFEPETIKAWEVGSKNRFFDNRVQLNLDAFYWTYENQQIPQITPVQPCPTTCAVFGVVSAKESHVYGIEADAQWLITEYDRVGLNVAWQKGEFDDYRTPAVGPPFNIAAVNNSGGERPYTPRWVVDFNYEHTFDLGGRGDVVAAFHTHWQDDQLLVNVIDARFPRALQVQESFSMSDASLTYNAPENRWSVGVYVNNIEEEAVRTNFANQAPAGVATANLMAPRTYGVRLNARFGGAEPPPPPPPPAPPPAPAPTPPPTPVYEAREFIVYFPFDQSVLTPEAQTVVSQAAAYAQGGAATRVVVVGHADTSGSAAYNVRLSERRAKAVADALAGAGVAQTALSVDWKGESMPAVQTGDGVKEPLNRRATIGINF